MAQEIHVPPPAAKAQLLTGLQNAVPIRLARVGADTVTALFVTLVIANGGEIMGLGSVTEAFIYLPLMLTMKAVSAQVSEAYGVAVKFQHCEYHSPIRCRMRVRLFSNGFAWVSLSIKILTKNAMPCAMGIIITAVWKA